MVEIDKDAADFIRSHRVARLATANADRQPSVVPICYVFDGKIIYTPIDQKPKRVGAGELRRVQNIQSNNRVAFVVDDYSEDWSALGYILISGTAEILSSDHSEHSRAVDMLREKYPQYRTMKLEDRPIIKISPARIKHWTGTAGHANASNHQK
jgi:PPOX class probable F420-dependent enzyme